MSVTIDPSLGSVAQASPPGVLGRSEPPVARAGPAGPAPVLLEGERIAVAGTEREGARAFWVGGRLAAADLATDAGVGVNVVLAPASLRREVLGRGASLVEITLAAPTLPLAAVQWQAPPPVRRGGSLGLGLTLLPGCREARYHVRGEGLRAVGTHADGAELCVELRLHPVPTEWRVREEGAGGIRVSASVSAPGLVTLLLAAGTSEAAARAMAGAPHLSAHEARAASDADAAAIETLTTSTGIPDLDDGVVWATARVRGSLLRGPAGPADAVLWSGLGALAVGDATAAARALDGLPHGALSAFLAARLTLLSGDPAPALEAYRRLDAFDAGSGAALDPEARALRGLALETLADALRYAAGDREILALRRAAALPNRIARGVRLPMAGFAPRPTSADTLRSALASASDPDEAWVAWRGSLSQGMAGGPTCRGAWDPPSRPPGPAPGAGRLLCRLAHGLLGLSPDAPSGRIRIAPALPAHVAGFTAKGIRVGDAALSLRYERDGPRHRLTLEPTRGRTPATVALEPSLPLASIGSARVDGAPAELDRATAGGRTRVRVQVVLDAPRTLEIDAAL